MRASLLGAILVHGISTAKTSFFLAVLLLPPLLHGFVVCLCPSILGDAAMTPISHPTRVLEPMAGGRASRGIGSATGRAATWLGSWVLRHVMTWQASNQLKNGPSPNGLFEDVGRKKGLPSPY